jgi:hypothetical protein
MDDTNPTRQRGRELAAVAGTLAGASGWCGLRATRAKTALEIQDFENAERAAQDYFLWLKDVLPRATFPSVAERFFFSGRTGSPPIRVGRSPVVPGKFGKEMGRNETRFLEKPPRGPGEGTDRNGLGAQRTLLLPFHRGGRDIIGTGVMIVFSFHSDFLEALASWCLGFSCFSSPGVHAWERRAGTGSLKRPFRGTGSDSRASAVSARIEANPVVNDWAREINRLPRTTCRALTFFSRWPGPWCPRRMSTSAGTRCDRPGLSIPPAAGAGIDPLPRLSGAGTFRGGSEF